MRKIITKIVLAKRMILFFISCKLIKGNFVLLSIITKSTSEIIPMVMKLIVGIVLVTLFSSEYESANRTEVIVAARVIAPFTSMDLV